MVLKTSAVRRQKQQQGDAKISSTAPTASVAAKMEVEDVSSGDNPFIIIICTLTECKLDTIQEIGDVFVSKMDEYKIMNFDQSTVLHRVKEAAGASFGHVSVLLPTLNCTNDLEMRTTSWIVRETEYVPTTLLPNRIEDMLVAKPAIGCLFFDSILPTKVNADTRAFILIKQLMR